MPKVVITGERGTHVEFAVADKAEAVRMISSRLMQAFPRKYVEKALNDWLKSGMKVHLNLGHSGDRFIIVYKD